MIQQIEQINAERVGFMERVATVPVQDRGKYADRFLDSIEEAWREIHVDALMGNNVEEITAFSEELASFIIGFIEKEDKNYIAWRNDMLGRVHHRISGLNLSTQLLNRIENLSRNINWR